MNKTPGRPLFLAGNIVLLLLGIVHLLPFFASNLVPPGNQIEIEVHRALHALKYDMGPFHATGWHTTQLLSGSYSTLVIFVAILNFFTMGPMIAAGCFRTLTVVNLVFTAILLGITLVYQFPPPMVFSLVALILFGVSLMRQRPALQAAI